MIGFCLIVVGILIGWVTGLFRQVPHQKRIYGKIIQVEKNNSESVRRMRYRAHVEYIVNGYKYVMKTKYSRKRQKVGTKVKLAYNQYMPSVCILCAAPASGFLVLGLIFVGIILVCVQYF